MQVFISINNSNIILSNQILNTGDPLPFRLMELNLVFCKYLFAQWCRSWSNHRIKSVNTKSTMMINKRFEIRGFTIKNANDDGETAHLIQGI